MYQFYKAQGLGNDFVIFIDQDIQTDHSKLSKKIADRRFGVGCDQIIFLDTQQHIPVITFFNADGSQAESCGNGTRCTAFLYMQLFQCEEVTFSSLGGDLFCRQADSNMVSVQLKMPIIKGDIPLTPSDVFFNSAVYVDVGNPHLIILDPVEDFLTFGRNLEHHPAFPHRTNVGFARVMGPHHINLKVWERGSGPTLACGSGACAAAVAAYHKGLCSTRIDVNQPGGVLHIDIQKDAIIQTGHVEIIFKAEFLQSFLSE